MSATEKPSVGLRVWQLGDPIGKDVTFGPGEVIRILPPVCTLVVQVVGGVLPKWATPSSVMDGVCDVELIVIRGVPPPLDPLNHGLFPKRLNVFSSKDRIVVSDNLESKIWSEKDFRKRRNFFIKASTKDLEPISEAIATLLAGKLSIGLDWADVLACAGVDHSTRGFGSAVVVEGVHEASSVRRLHAALEGFAKDGFKGGLLLMQLVAEVDDAKFSLEGIEALVTQVFARADNRNRCCTAALGASYSAVVLVAFNLQTVAKTRPPD